VIASLSPSTSSGQEESKREELLASWDAILHFPQVEGIPMEAIREIQEFCDFNKLFHNILKDENETKAKKEISAMRLVQAFLIQV